MFIVCGSIQCFTSLQSLCCAPLHCFKVILKLVHVFDIPNVNIVIRCELQGGITLCLQFARKLIRAAHGSILVVETVREGHLLLYG